MQSIKERIEEISPGKKLSELECSLAEEKLRRMKFDEVLVEKLTDLKEVQKVMNQS
jgi:hypothetical protein